MLNTDRELQKTILYCCCKKQDMPKTEGHRFESQYLKINIGRVVFIIFYRPLYFKPS